MTDNGPSGLNYLQKALDAKDARIVALEGRAQVAEELVKKLQKEAGKHNERWAIMVREVDKRDARIAELEQKLHKLDREAWDQFDRLNVAENHAQGAQQRATSLLNDRNKWKKRAEAAEARVNLFQRYHQEDLDEIAALGKRAEAAEARLKEVDSDRWGLLNRAEDAEARVRELERQYYLTARSVGFGWQIKADRDTFTAPDGRVFRVGQRVWLIWDEPGEFGHVTDINGGSPLVQFQDSEDQTHPDSLRRVWDGSEEPDVPVGTVLRDAYGLHLERLSDTRWELQDEKGDPLGKDEWDKLDGEQFRPYVEVLPGDDD